MIPLRVTMKGWMRYRDEQTADFTGARLIAIVGDNGAGKSSIFDAMKYALYGSHRLGRTGTEELISQGGDLLSVTFEFEVNGQQYRVERTAGRRSGDGRRGLYFLDVDTREWQIVKGSERRELLDQQIAEIIRMSEEAFTSSFLLQQGEATRFLDAAPRERFGIISSLIGLSAYERLHARVGEIQRETKGALNFVTDQLKEYEGIDAARVAELQAARDAASCALDQARATADAASQRATAAAAFAVLSAEIAELDRAITDAEALIVRKDDIERDARMYERLAQTRGAVAQIRDDLAAAGRAAAEADRASAAANAIDIAAAEAGAKAAAAQATATEKAREEAAAARDAALEHAASAAAALATAEAIDAARRAIADCDERIAGYDAALSGADAAYAERDRLAAISDAMPHLRGLREAFEAREKAAKADPAAVVAAREAELSALEGQAPALAEAISIAEAQQAAAQHQRAAADAEVRTLADELAVRESAAKEATCSRCGQPIDKKRAAAEVADLKRRAATAAADAKAAASAVAAADKQVAAARKAEADARARIASAGLELSRARDAAQAAEATVALIATRRATACEAAPSDLAARIEAAASEGDVKALIAGFLDLPARLKAAREQADALALTAGRRTEAMRERDAAAATLADLAAGAGGSVDVARARADDREARAASDRLRNAAIAAAEAARTAARAATDASAALQQARDQRAAHEATSSTAKADAAGHRRAAEGRAGGLEDEHRALALSEPEVLLRSLDERASELAGAPALLAALQAASERRAVAAMQRAERAAAAAAIAEDHRVEPERARADHAAAEASAAAAAQALRAAEADALRAEERLNAAAGLKSRQDELAKRARHLTTLRRLLGREGLQGALVKEALVTITSHANAFLRRLTGGSLQLTLRRGERSDALELRAVDATCMTEAVDVHALSGSQKFRCAVAIASGIGQFVGAGGMRSIVIDEGFSSLDEQSQVQMVDELKQLAEHMDKVIVVSHLEPYKDPVNFPDQLRIEPSGDRSVIRRVA